MKINNFYPKKYFFDKEKKLKNDYYANLNHYSKNGSKVIANIIFNYLKKKKLSYIEIQK